MKQAKIWKWVLVSLSAGGVLALVGLGALFTTSSGEGRRGEDQPQFTGPPGLSSKGARLWGMPNHELYTPIDSPRYVTADEASRFLRDDDRVYLIRKGDGLYVFPEVLLTSYHVVNDVIDGEPLAVTFCFLAGSASRFSRKVGDKVLTLGLTGQLYCGNSVLYDRETGTDWLQMNGEPLRGHFFGKARLEARPLERASWRRVRSLEGIKVLAPLRDVEEYRKFQRDMESEKLGRKVVESQMKLDERLLPYTRGLGVLVQGEPRFYPQDPHGPASARNEQVGGWGLLVLQGGDEDSGRIFRRFHRGQRLDFEVRGESLRDQQTGSRWSDEGVCLDGPLAGGRLDPPFHTSVYWFVWSSLYPESSLN